MGAVVQGRLAVVGDTSLRIIAVPARVSSAGLRMIRIQVEVKLWFRLETCGQVLLMWGEGWTVSWRVDGVEDALRQ